jgi:hypothetical protein
MPLLNRGSKAPGLRNLRTTFTSPRYLTLMERLHCILWIGDCLGFKRGLVMVKGRNLSLSRIEAVVWLISC